MLHLLLRRLIQLPLILAVVFVVTFVLAWVAPGDPLSAGEGRELSPQVKQALERQYNLDNPWRFALSYLGNAARGNLGPCITDPHVSVNQVIAQGLPISAALGFGAMILALIIGLVAGVIGAVRPGTPLDLASTGIAVVGISLPTFVTGSVLLLIFAGFLNWAPVGGWEWPTGAPWQALWWRGFGQMLEQMALPALTLALTPAAYIARLIRLGLADVLHSDFIRTARAKGLSPRKVLTHHAMKVAFLPVLSFLGPAAAAVMTGSFVVEAVFNIPGLGRPFINSVLAKDQSLILGIVLVYALMLISFNLIVDLAYAWFDPRIDLHADR